MKRVPALCRQAGVRSSSSSARNNHLPPGATSTTASLGKWTNPPSLGKWDTPPQLPLSLHPQSPSQSSNLGKRETPPTLGIQPSQNKGTSLSRGRSSNPINPPLNSPNFGRDRYTKDSLGKWLREPTVSPEYPSSEPATPSGTRFSRQSDSQRTSRPTPPRPEFTKEYSEPVQQYKRQDDRPSQRQQPRRDSAFDQNLPSHARSKPKVSFGLKPEAPPLVSRQPEQDHFNNMKYEEETTPSPVYFDTYIPEPAEDINDTRRNRQPVRSARSKLEVIQELKDQGIQPGIAGWVDSEPQGPLLQQKKPKVKKFKRDAAFKKVLPDVYIPSTVSVGTLAQLLNIRLEQLQWTMSDNGMEKESHHDYMLTSDYAVLFAQEFGYNPIVDDEKAFDVFPSPPHPNPSSLPLRPPVITIMGHVDHGKTTILDTLRSASVAKGEAGGITQHIGAFSVAVPGGSNNIRSITFLDTPGHAAFSAMRARGAHITDIIVLVVAADDGVMPQTKEVIELIKQEQDHVGVVVAVNKIDKHEIDIKLVEKELLAEGLQLETFGGDIPSIHVSGLTGKGLPELLETLSLVAEMRDLRAENEGPVHGFIVESKVQKGLGSVATVLVTRGTLKPGSHLISGTHQCRVRALVNNAGVSVASTGPGTAVTVSGWKTLPNAGDDVLQGTESDIKKALANRMRKIENQSLLVDAEVINEARRKERLKRDMEARLAFVSGAVAPPSIPGQIIHEEGKEGGPQTLNLVIKADVSGSEEAVVGALQGMGNDVIKTKIISAGVGELSESDLNMAQTSNGMLVAFSIPVSKPFQRMAERENIPIASSNIIYRLIELVRDKLIERLPKIVELEVTGSAAVLQLFDIHVKGSITQVAGCRVTDGILEKTKQVRVLRGGAIIFDGKIDSLRHHRDVVTEIRKGAECGITLTEFSDIMPGDVIESYVVTEKPGIL